MDSPDDILTGGHSEKLPGLHIRRNEKNGAILASMGGLLLRFVCRADGHRPYSQARYRRHDYSLQSKGRT